MVFVRKQAGTALLALAITAPLVVMTAPAAVAADNRVTLVSRTDSEIANGVNDVRISGDGSTVVFAGDWESDVGWIWAIDRRTGQRHAVDVTTDGSSLALEVARQQVRLLDLSDDGRFVIFATDADVVGIPLEGDCGREVFDEDDNSEIRPAPCPHIYRRDLLTSTTELVSVGPDGLAIREGAAQASISGDGRFVAINAAGSRGPAFYDWYRPDGFDGSPQLYLRDMTEPTSQNLTAYPNGDPRENHYGDGVDISANGDTVVFQSDALFDSSPPRSEDWPEVYVWERLTNDIQTLVPPSLPLPAREYLGTPSVSDDGQRVGLTLQGTGEGNLSTIYDRTTQTFERPALGQTETDPEISGDGRFLMFWGYAGSLPDSSPFNYYNYLFDSESGVTTRATTDSAGQPIDGIPADLSDSGRFVVFRAPPGADGSYPGPGYQAYVHDRTAPADSATGTGGASTDEGSGTSYDDQVETTVSGSPGAVTVTELAADDPDGLPLEDWLVFGQQVEIAAAPPTAPAYLTFRFDVDRSAIPFGQTPDDVDILRNGVPLPDCANASDPGSCVLSREVLSNGGWRFIAHSPSASLWAVALSLNPVVVDEEPPTITLTAPANGATYSLNQSVSAAYTCDDSDGSGVDVCQGTVANGAAVNTSSTGPKTFSVTAVDQAGNSTTAEVAYSVRVPATGFFSPVDNPPTVNTMRAGKIVPVRFSLGSNRGLNIFAPGYPQSQRVTCPSRPNDEIETLLRSARPSLSYGAGRYTYAWQSQRAWAGTCRELVVRFSDGQELTAVFRFRR